MFKSATLKLTGWYILILIAISLVFSVTIYTIASNEIDTRLEHLQMGLQDMPGLDTTLQFSNALRGEEARASASHLFYELLYVNIIIIILGGIGSYILARRMLRPIEAAHEAQSRFVSDASHELRTPLAAMKAEIEVVLRDKKALPADFHETLSSNLDEIGKLSRLSEMLLKLSRLDHDKLDLGPTNLNEIIEQVVRRARQPKERIAVYAPKHFTVIGNEPALADLVTILVDNAIKYSPDTSQITIHLSRRGRFVCLTIANVGAGITEEKLPHIFERFYRADTSRTSATHKNYGLGLGIAKDIVELHAGELSVSSGPKQLTTFTVLLPNFK